MTQILITIDTELSAQLFQQGASVSENYARSIDCVVDGTNVGVSWQMDRLERCGLTGVFFVDPMPALVYGPDFVARIVQPIAARGHEVQLHIHTEWLAWAKSPPVRTRGQNIGDFSKNDQHILLTLARQMLIDAGAPPAIAFRAGNYGANDDTLRVLSELGLRWDSSFNAAYLGNPCQIDLNADQINPVRRLGLTEVPVAGIFDRPGRIRHAQICALSSREMRAALNHAAATEQPVFAIVTHSFEMLSRDRLRANRAVMARFESLCRHVAETQALESVGFANLDPDVANQDSVGERLSANAARTYWRMGEQALATWRFERQLHPA